MNFLGANFHAPTKRHKVSSHLSMRSQCVPGFPSLPVPEREPGIILRLRINIEFCNLYASKNMKR